MKLKNIFLSTIAVLGMVLIKGTNIGEFSDGYALFLKHFSDTAHLVPYVAQK